MVALRLLTVLLILTISATTYSESINNVSGFEYEDLAADYTDFHTHHDYSYDDYHLYYEPNVSNVTLRKCFCGLDQIWNGSACEIQETIVPILDYYTGSSFLINTTSFENVTIGEVTCPPRTVRVTLNSFSSHVGFYVVEAGMLDWYHILFEDYCVEHTYDTAGQPNDWFAQICLEPPLIPRCCSEGQSLISNGSCVASSSNYDFLPPVKAAGQLLMWPSMLGEEAGDISCTNPEDLLTLELDNSSAVLEYIPTHLKPSLSWTSPIAIKHFSANFTYCVGMKTESETKPVYIAKFCYKDPIEEHQEKCENKTCVRKCCNDSQIYSLGGCTPYSTGNSTHLFNPVFHDPSNFNVVEKPKDLELIHGFPLCNVFFQLRPHIESDDTFHLLQNGYLHASAFPKPYPPTKYCLDDYLDSDSGTLHILPVVCFEDEDMPSAICVNIQTYLYPVLLIVSIGFLGITVMVYLCVPELHAKVHGKCLLSHVTALLMAYVSLLIVQRTTENLKQFGCKFMASVTHFSFLAAFFWLNVMCFDIWWTLKSMRPVPETGELSRLRFKLYSLYSWGCPMVITVVSVIIQSLPDEVEVIRPEFGKSKCWFSDNVSLWAYFYGFVLVLAIANIIFFCQVAHILIVAQNDPILQRTRQQDRERMWLYVKLFLVMGITWVTEVISWQEGTCEAWIFTDIINSLQGVSIFVIFICKRNLIKKVRSKWEPYLRHVKEVVGSKRLSHSKFSTSGTRNTGREQLSFSSENRPNHSAASHGTVQSQLSIDPSTVNRKISTGSLSTTTGVQVHTQNNMPMDSIAESTKKEEESTKTVPVEKRTDRIEKPNITTDQQPNIVEKNVGVENCDDSPPMDNTEVPERNGKLSEITINGSVIPVHNPKESSYSENDFASTHSQVNQSYINEDDETVDV